MTAPAALDHRQVEPRRIGCRRIGCRGVGWHSGVFIFTIFMACNSAAPRAAAHLPLLLSLLLIGIAGGCAETPRHPEALGLSVPPDFALELHVDGDPAAEHPLRRTTRLVLEPNRKLRVAQGEAAAVRSYPPLRRVIQPAELERLYDLIARHRLMREPDSPAVPPEGALSNDAVYSVWITAHGRTHAYRTTPAESPPTALLLRQLLRLAE